MAERISKNSLAAKARAFTISIQKMDEKQRSRSPSGEYGNDYNRLRRLVEEQYPEFRELLPPPVQLFEGSDSHFSRQSYSEIDTFCEQIVQLLSS